MKLTTFTLDGHSVPAALLTSGRLVNLVTAAKANLLGQAPLRELEDILYLDGPLAEPTRRLVDRLEAGETVLLDQLNTMGGLHDSKSAVYAPILRPRLIVSCGMSYKEHNQEMKVSMPKDPISFMKTPTAICAHNEAIVLPPNDPGMVDYECEFSVVIGRMMHNVTPEEALSHIAGFTMINDVGSRVAVTAWMASIKGDDPMECVRLNNANVLEKQHPTFCPMGPVIETADSFGDPNEFSVQTKLNGEVVQSADSSDLIFPIAYTLSYFSRWYRFMPGDVLTTGSPSGVGFARIPPRMLQVGDVVEVSSPKLGTLSNPVVAG